MGNLFSALAYSLSQCCASQYIFLISQYVYWSSAFMVPSKRERHLKERQQLSQFYCIWSIIYLIFLSTLFYLRLLLVVGIFILLRLWKVIAMSFCLCKVGTLWIGHHTFSDVSYSKRLSQKIIICIGIVE